MFNSAVFTLAVQNSLIVYALLQSVANTYSCILNCTDSKLPLSPALFSLGFFPCNFYLG